MTTPLTLSTHHRPDGTAVLTAAGEIDMSNADAFRAGLDTAAAKGDRLVVDLTAVEYLDSAGLTALFAHAPHLDLIVPPLLHPLLTVSGLASVVTVHVT
ncbi:STAS domain-containing protein [Microbispora sp. NPDC049125]|uniref:STAS domain-containing protein n=1 Tax=Microbispora sp. NPDC049125 TaxID=3154929 RepID=UPI003466AEEF